MNEAAARRRYRRLLVIGPRRLRARHTDAMTEAFLDRWRAAHARGRLAVASAWLRAAADLLLVARRSEAPSLTVTSRSALMIGSDARLALRTLWRQPFATSLLLVMLTLGIAANVVVFSIVNDLFLKPFPFAEPDRLVYINEKAPRWNLEETGINYPDFAQWRKTSRAFAGMGLVDSAAFNLSDDRGAERVEGATVTFDYFGVIGVQPVLGRTFTETEDRPKAPDVALISEAMWRERFGGAHDVLGKTIRLNRVVFQIIGVMPKRAEFPLRVSIWVPLKEDPAATGRSYSYTGIGRLKPGITVQAAEADLLLAHAPIYEIRDQERAVAPFVRPLHEHFVRNFRVMASALSAAVILLLVVACTNVAAMMLARAIGRRREMGIRLAIGAGRVRLMRQLFVENVLLAAIGGVLGLVLGRWALYLLVTSVTDVLPSWATFAFDWRIATFAIAVAAATAVLFGWAPAMHAVRGDFRSAMADASAGTTVSPRGRRTLNTLVSAEFMLAAMLVVGGGLLVRAFTHVRQVDPGYRADHVLQFAIALPRAGYPENEQTVAFWQTLADTLRTAPGVEAVGVITCPPLTCHLGNFFRVEGRPPLKAGQADPVTLHRVADAGYFTAMGIRLVEGRFFDEREAADKAARVVVVNESYARTFWPGEKSVVGKRISYNSDESPWITVVGVVRDVKHYGRERPMRPGVYFPMRQDPDRTRSMSAVVRTTGDPAAFTATARGIVKAIDPTLPLYRVQTAEERLAASMQTRATYSWMLGVFAALALLLALGGAYGVSSYLVTQRTREIGIRMALGARAADIMRAMMTGSAFAIGVGVGAGLTVVILTGGWLGDLLFGVSPRDPLILATAVATLAIAAAVATVVPARRAARISPVMTLKM